MLVYNTPLTIFAAAAAVLEALEITRICKLDVSTPVSGDMAIIYSIQHFPLGNFCTTIKKLEDHQTLQMLCLFLCLI